jgi:uncharacterized YccA/Bax inhibitor family protein
MRTSNPVLSNEAFRSTSPVGLERMSINGAVNRCFALLGLLLLSAIWSWNHIFAAPFLIDRGPQIPVWYFPILIGGFVLALVIVFKKTTAPWLAPLYALAQGMLLGTLSALMETRYPGIALQAVVATSGVLLAMLAAYRSGLLRATEKFRMGVVAATGGIALMYVIDLVLRLFGMNVPFLHESGTLGIAVSGFIVVVAALNLVLDFDFIERASAQGLPRYMEWYAAFGLLVTLVWLYLEILRLIAKLRSRR